MFKKGCDGGSGAGNVIWMKKCGPWLLWYRNKENTYNLQECNFTRDHQPVYSRIQDSMLAPEINPELSKLILMNFPCKRQKGNKWLKTELIDLFSRWLKNSPIQLFGASRLSNWSGNFSCPPVLCRSKIHIILHHSTKALISVIIYKWKMLNWLLWKNKKQ